MTIAETKAATIGATMTTPNTVMSLFMQRHTQTPPKPCNEPVTT